MINRVLPVGNLEKRTVVGVDFHLVIRFPLLRCVQVFLKYKSVRVDSISNCTVKKTVVNKGMILVPGSSIKSLKGSLIV